MGRVETFRTSETPYHFNQHLPSLQKLQIAQSGFMAVQQNGEEEASAAESRIFWTPSDKVSSCKTLVLPPCCASCSKNSTQCGSNFSDQEPLRASDGQLQVAERGVTAQDRKSAFCQPEVATMNLRLQNLKHRQPQEPEDTMV